MLLVPNAANTAEVVRRLQAAAPDGVSVKNHHDDYAVLAVQGTKSDEVLQSVGLPAGHEYMSFVEAQLPTCSAPRSGSWCAAPATPASAATS